MLKRQQLELALPTKPSHPNRVIKLNKIRSCTLVAQIL